MFPLVGVSSPANMLNKVVLPEPDCPTIAIDADLEISHVISRNIVIEPSALETTLPTL